ncbi:MAG TPA: hypothetical protein DEP72_00520 [Clostridiales bacterium]|nr:MAG: hypothetical protein A2Y18_03225 [Clostridiales bacterium GWD2_32_19]HCC06635.1 hypothetical protein [Clostridiales bacterium]
METSIIIGVIVFVLVLAFISIYNGIILMTNKVNEAFSTMDVYLKKRYNLIPNLIQTVKEYMSHEKEILQSLVNARTLATQSTNSENIISSNNEISIGLQKVLLMVEAYPNLKASTNFLELQKELNQIEEDITNARKYYNGSVREYNNYISIFPNLIVADILNKKEKMYFRIEVLERENQEVKF